ncbi:MAG: glycosyltransferase family 4 protein [Candidatus Obscuribacterales bacterium]|nr:glycosyltransferase family 4 protein [Candidatus Obscuribacterales bacterium]
MSCNSNVQQSAAALAEASLLQSFHTTLAFSKNDVFIRLLNNGLKSQFLRRTFPINHNLIITHPAREFCRLALQRVGAKFLPAEENSPFSIDSVGRDFDRSVAHYLTESLTKSHHDIKAVYGYEDFSYQTFKTAKNFGLKTMYELCIPFWQTTNSILKEEAERLPEWAQTIRGLKDSSFKLERKTKELELADTILCISNFVERSIPPELKKNKNCLVVDFGCPDIAPPPLRQANKQAPLRLLFAGTLTQRKGLADIFAACKLLKRKDIELIVMGAPAADMDFYRKQFPEFIYEPPGPQARVFEIMRHCDVFVLPSLSEGRGLVQLEAMANRMPLITTANATGDDLIQEGKTGFLVPIRSPESLAEKFNWFADHRDETAAMGNQARDSVLNWSWSRYRQQIVAAAKQVICDAESPG